MNVPEMSSLQRQFDRAFKIRTTVIKLIRYLAVSWCYIYWWSKGLVGKVACNSCGRPCAWVPHTCRVSRDGALTRGAEIILLHFQVGKHKVCLDSRMLTSNSVFRKSLHLIIWMPSKWEALLYLKGQFADCGDSDCLFGAYWWLDIDYLAYSFLEWLKWVVKTVQS